MTTVSVLRNEQAHPGLGGISRFEVNRRRFDLGPAADGADLAAAALCEVLYALEKEFGLAGDDPRLVRVMAAVELALRAART